MPGPRVLLVEDEFLIRQTLAEALADDGFEVVQAGSGEEAVGTLQQQEFALLVTDMLLSGDVDGRAVAAAARRRRPGLPAIFITGGPRTQPDGTASNEVFIAKPFLTSEVCAIARRLLAG